MSVNAFLKTEVPLYLVCLCFAVWQTVLITELRARFALGVSFYKREAKKDNARKNCPSIPFNHTIHLNISLIDRSLARTHDGG